MYRQNNTRYQSRIKREPVLEIDPGVESLISRIKAKQDILHISLASFEIDALTLFEEGCGPIMEYYLQADFGDCIKWLIEDKYKKPWSAVDQAKILATNHRSFTDYGVTINAELMGKTLQSLLSTPISHTEVEVERSLKILGIVMEALKMFPKTQPTYLPNIPTSSYEDILGRYRDKRKEMKRLWNRCVQYVELNLNRGEASKQFPNWEEAARQLPVQEKVSLKSNVMNKLPVQEEAARKIPSYFSVGTEQQYRESESRAWGGGSTVWSPSSDSSYATGRDSVHTFTFPKLESRESWPRPPPPLDRSFNTSQSLSEGWSVFSPTNRTSETRSFFPNSVSLTEESMSSQGVDIDVFVADQLSAVSENQLNDLVNRLGHDWE